MLISDFYASISYWLFLAFLLLLSQSLTRSRFLDFEFFILMLLSQYAMHSTLAFGFFSSTSLFCILFFFSYLISRMNIKWGFRKYYHFASQHKLTTNFDAIYIVGAKYFLIFYFLLRILYYPYMLTELSLENRLAASEENRLLFFMGIAVTPAITTCIYYWIKNQWNLKWHDYTAIFFTLIGLLGAGSKGVLLPFILAYFGVASYLGIRWWREKSILFSALIVVAITFYALNIFFPEMSGIDIIKLIGLRLASNTDSIEYLLILNISPSDYPYSGLGALLPYLTKFFGHQYEFSPGVWLHGQLYGVWTGYGPNSGIVMDYYGNLGWFGLLVPVLAGSMARILNKQMSAFGCSIYSIIPLAFSDVTLFAIPFIVWLSFASIVYMLAKSFEFGRADLDKRDFSAPHVS